MATAEKPPGGADDITANQIVMICLCIFIPVSGDRDAFDAGRVAVQ